MSKLVQCVPNFSEGRRVQEIEGIVAAIKGVPGVKVLDFSRDESHNRSVVTFLGEPEAVLEGAFQGAREAARVIDMSQHKGNCWSYPRKESGRWPGGGLVAVLLPGTTFYLREKHFAPARQMIGAGVPVALATDVNPGSCPNNNLQIIMTLASLYLEMTPEEVVNAMTINAAHALRLGSRIGSLEVGKQADIVLFDAPSYLYLPYRFGTNLVNLVVKRGRVVQEKDTA